MTTPEAADRTRVREAFVQIAEAELGRIQARELTSILDASFAAILTPLAPEVPPRRDGLRECAEAVVRDAEPDESFEGEFIDYVVPWQAIDALKAALAPQPPCPHPPEFRVTDSTGESCSRCEQWTAATRTPEPPDSGDGAAQRDREFETMWAFATRWNDMADLVRLMDSKATAHVENPDGTVESYIVPASALNRVLAFANGSKSQATKRALDKFRLRSGSPAPEGGE